MKGRTEMEVLRILPRREGELEGGNISKKLALLILVGFALRVVVAQVFLGGLEREYQGDEGDYVNLAIRMIQGLGFVDRIGNPTSYRTPGLPLLVAGVVGFSGLSVTAIRIFMCLVESALIPACYLLARSWSGSQKVGLIASTIAVVFPTWVVPSGSVLSDVPAAILVTLVAWTLIEGYRRQRVLWMVSCGVLWGIVILIRPVSLVYAPGVVLWLMLVMSGWRKRLTATGVVIVTAGCVLAPWTIRNTRVHGAFVLVSTQGGSELYKSNNPKATGILAEDHQYFDETLAQRYPKEEYPNEATRSNLFQAEAVKFIREHPLRFAQLCFIRFMQLWKLYSPRVPLSSSLGVIASFGVALPFFLIQVIRRGWRRGPEMLLLFIIISHTAAHVVFTAAVRYRIPIEPLVIVLAIGGFYGCFRRVEWIRAV